jgi:hypothetical protein
MSKEKRTRPPYGKTLVSTRLSHEDFVVAWQSAATLEDAAAAARTSSRSASVRAFNLRKAGVPLKLFKERTERLNVAALSDLAKKSLK